MACNERRYLSLTHSGHTGPCRPTNDVLKRAFDLSAATLGIVLLSPLMAVVALAVRLRLGSPVLFRQVRPGLYGMPFVILKFRTMTDDCDDHGALLPDAERLTAFGRFLRSSSLDELPELWNVIRGDLSLVGPRPLHVRYLDRYSAEQLRRHDVRPGITGWTQVNGRNDLSWDEKFSFDLWYVDHRSFLLDLRILAVTVWKIFRREGVNKTGWATTEEFWGSATTDAGSLR